MNTLFNLTNCLCRLHIRHCTANNLAASIFKTKNLFNSCINILCLCICHRLNQNRITAANHTVSYSYFFCKFSNLLCILFHFYPSHINDFSLENLYNIAKQNEYHKNEEENNSCDMNDCLFFFWHRLAPHCFN